MLLFDPPGQIDSSGKLAAGDGPAGDPPGRLAGVGRTVAGSAAPPGSSMRHMWPQEDVSPAEFRVAISRGGNCVRLTEQGGRSRPRGRGGTRGKVKGFSAASRLNMLALVHSINEQHIAEGWFGTLTYPESHNPTWATIERDRRVWEKRFFRQWGKSRAFIVWKKEVTKKGVVHLHVLVFWLKDGAAVPRLKGEGGFWEWNDRAWAEVCNTGHASHAKVACKFIPLRKLTGAGSYCSKYMAKDQAEFEQGDGTGRIWGVSNRALLRRCVSVDLQRVPKPAGVIARRTLRKLQQRRRTAWLVQITAGGPFLRLKPWRGKSVAVQLEEARAAGLPIKRRRPRCMMTKSVPIYAEVTEEGVGYSSESVAVVDSERWTFASSLHFVSEALVRRVLENAMDVWLQRLEDDHSLPF